MKKIVLSEKQIEVVNQNKELSFLLPKHLNKSIWALTLPIYLQLISTVVLSLINNLLLRWVENGIYTSIINKANFAYSWFSFIPTFSSAGIFVVIGNMIGNKKKDEIYKSVFQGLFFNISLCLLVIIGLFFSKNFIYQWANLPEADWLQADILYYTNLVVLFLVSIHIVLQRVEAASGSLKKLFLIILISGLINTIFVSSTMFFINPVLSVSIGVLITNTFILVGMFYLNNKHVNFKKIFSDNKNCWDSEILKTILIVSIPSVVETLAFNFAAAISTRFITGASILYGEDDILFATLISVQQITNFGLLMSSALGQVSLIYVSRLKGSNMTELCVPISKKIWLLTLFVSMPFSLVMVSLSYPLLKIYNIPNDVIWNIGIYMFMIIAVQDLGRGMNQVGLSSLRAVKYTIVPVIVSLLTLITFNIGFIYLAYHMMDIKNYIDTIDQHNQVDVMRLAKNYLLVVCSIQAFEEIVRGGLYMILWVTEVWNKKNRGKINDEKNEVVCSTTRALG